MPTFWTNTDLNINVILYNPSTNYKNNVPIIVSKRTSIRPQIYDVESEANIKPNTYREGK